MHIGLIVGIGPAATDFYYRSLIHRMADLGVALELTMAHADTSTLLRNQEGGQIGAQVAIYERLTRRLQAAGARAVAVTSIAGHFCIDEFAAVSPVPVINLLKSVEDEVAARRYRTVALLGTQGVMESRLFGSLRGVEVLAPDAHTIGAVHDAYVSMAQSGVCTDQQRAVFVDAGQEMVSQGGAQAILLAGTDLVLAFGNHEPGFPVVDCASVHAAAIADVAFDDMR
ncbi:aspartate/glutamate racemase family protein [Paenarthrobacter sp. Z7-10]|uniref:aspartate/glutamate racemase family protein n=1 Tax=Paenarthrobacter sp. Z7-10 TaxID=2787635 RepID=UPI0022A9BFE2|nr:aspartate/glutamate racemase family protein [Paenarthrobacter sp. Z7-10]MCZ2404468.1 aspartate/glutamate racemase family protein [Paenarthrobacter sp. Z7-10]